MPTTINLSSLSPEYKKAYNAGWRYSLGPCANGLDHGDSIGAPEAWYDGYLDAACGYDKWTKPAERIAAHVAAAVSA